MPEDDGRIDLDEAQIEMAKRAAESGLEIMRRRCEKRLETTVPEREVRARIPEARGQKRISEDDGRADLDEKDSGFATKNTRVGHVHISKSTAGWCDIIDETEMDPLLNLENWKMKEVPSVHVRRTPNDGNVRIEGRALREAPHIRRDSNAQTESPLLTAPGDEPLGSTLGVVWVSCDSEWGWNGGGSR